MKLYNRNFSVSDRIEYMGWVNEGVLNNNHPWQNYKPRFFALKGTDLMLFDSPPVRTQNCKPEVKGQFLILAEELNARFSMRNSAKQKIKT